MSKNEELVIEILQKMKKKKQTLIERVKRIERNRA